MSGAFAVRASCRRRTVIALVIPAVWPAAGPGGPQDADPLRGRHELLEELDPRAGQVCAATESGRRAPASRSRPGRARLTGPDSAATIRGPESGPGGDMAQVIVRGRGTGFAQDVVVDCRRLVADEPEAAGGTDAGPTRYAYPLVALGS